MNNAEGECPDRNLQPMRICETAVYRGPQVFSNQPMVRVQLDLGELENWPTHRLPGFTEKLTGLLPHL
ncbi:hypothetical protein [Phyllobacterium phragmitis]|uniref:hypothetical protein n=1 Tax=Phyllobacterium phragmitis TaxID=2670329 RepID=UPI0038B30920